MRKTIFSIIAVILLLAAKTAYADYDISGRWLLEGGGFAEKSALRVELTDEGFLDIQTQIEGDVRYVLGYSVGLWLNASKIGVNAWEYHKKVDLEFPIPMPSLDPTMSEPFELPPVTVDRLTYEVTFTSLLSGTVKIYGHLDIDVVGDVEIDSVSAIWKEGTEKPDIPDMTSGCDSGASGVIGMALVWGMSRVRRKLGTVSPSGFPELTK